MRTRPLTIYPATPARWEDLTSVFGHRGGPARCWCQYFIDPEWSFDASEANRAALQCQVVGQHPSPGLIAYLDEEPAGWVEVGPRERYPNARLPLGNPATWAITCFVVRPVARHTGIATEMLEAAVDHAERNAATRLLARPVDTDGGRLPGGDLYTGVLSTFLSHGFHEVLRRGHRVVVELALPRP